MARDLIVRLVADTSNLERSLKKAGAGLTLFSRRAEGLSKTGSSAFGGFGKSLAIATGGFVALHEGSKFFEDSIRAATDAAVANRALAAQMKANGEQFAANKDLVDRATLSVAKFGFTSEDATHALTVLDRGTGNISKSVQLLGLTANLARARNIDFAASAGIVAKVFGGQETALRRAVPGLSKTAHGTDLLREAQRKLAGQAAAGTTPQEKFAAALHDTEVNLGTLLLPTVNRYLESLSKFLDRTNKSKDAQGKMKLGVDTATTSVSLAGRAVGLFARGLGTAMQASASAGATAEKMAEAFGLVKGAGDKTADSMQHWTGVFRDMTRAASGLRTALQAVSGSINPALNPNAKGPTGFGYQSPLDFLATNASDRSRGGGLHPVNITNVQRNTFFDARIARMIERAQIGSLREQITNLTAVRGLLEKARSTTRDITRRGTLGDEIFRLNQTIFGDRTQIAQNQQTVRANRNAAAAVRQQAVLDKLQLGVDRTTLTPTLKDDIAAESRLIGGLKKQIRLHGSTIALQEQLIQAETTILSLAKQRYDNLHKAKAATSSDRLSDLFVKQSPEKLAAWLGLAGDRTAIAKLATLGRGNRLATGRSTAFAGSSSVVINGDVHVHGVQDPRAFEAAMAKRAKGRPSVRRGAT
jgi:hypothetical protein